MKFYFIRNCYSAQIEAWCLFGLRLGYTTFGLALWPPTENSRPWWVPHIHLSLWAHTGRCDQRNVFKFQVGRRYISYLTRGDATPDLLAYGDAGLSVH